jgi:ribose transport system permease protein
LQESGETPTTGTTGAAPKRRRLVGLGVDRLSGVYLLIILSVVYSLTEPSTFFTLNNFRIVLSGEAITGIVTLGLMVSLICGIFDLSIAANMSWTIIFVGWLQSHGVNWVLSIVLAVAAGALIGVLNAVVVTQLHVDSVIGTLGMSSILAALTYWISNGQSISTGLSSTFTRLGNDKWLTIPLPVYFLAAIALILWYVLNYTPTGRYLYAIGANVTAARLAGLKVLRLQWLGLITSATVAALAGVIFTAQLGTSSFDAGAPYLLPAFSAVFLGATQIRPGRFNVWGTVVSIYLLAVGVKGLELKWPAEPWITDLFDGVVLIVAVALAVRSARRRMKARA